MMIELDEVADTFDLLGDWDQRYQYLIELGEQMGPMPADLKTQQNQVQGCISQVWVSAYPDEVDPSRVHYHGDCDTSIIKGVLGLLIQLVSGKTVAEIEALDVDEFFERLGLDENLSPNRHVGVYAIVDQMKRQAQVLHHAGLCGTA